MKKKKTKFCKRLLTVVIAMTAMLCTASVTNAQSGNLNFDMQMVFKPNGMENYTSDTAKCVLTLQDTVNIWKVHLKMKNYNTGQTTLQHSFLFDSNASMPGGAKWIRKGNTATLVLGSFPVFVYDVEVALEDKSHNMSPVKYFFR